ncbi:MAG: CDP-alcohol phosphatidyltransferase family protein, partial [Oricola sp.]
ATDAADGPLARRFGVASRAGAHFDFWADFVLIEAAFAGFAQAGSGPWALPALTALAFGFFVATVRLTPGIYDPVGRNIGGILMGAAFAVLALRDLLVAEVAYLVALGALVVTIGARAMFVAGSLAAGIRPTAP